jgi:uncharacterized ion transporter superfamily protein YfcC
MPAPELTKRPRPGAARTLSKVRYDRYLRFVSPFLAAVFVSNCVFLGGAAAIG